MSKTIKNTIWLTITAVAIILAGIAGQINKDSQYEKETPFQNYSSYVISENARLEESDETQYELTPSEYEEKQLDMIPEGLNEHDQEVAKQAVKTLSDKYEAYWNNVY